MRLIRCVECGIKVDLLSMCEINLRCFHFCTFNITGCLDTSYKNIFLCFCLDVFAVGLSIGPWARGATELHVSSQLNMAAYLNEVKTICLDFFFCSFFPPFLPPPWAEIIGWHALAALFMTCFVKDWELHWDQGKQGEFCFSALLGTGLQHYLMSDRSQPGRLALFPRCWKKCF